MDGTLILNWEASMVAAKKSAETALEDESKVYIVYRLEMWI